MLLRLWRHTEHASEPVRPKPSKMQTIQCSAFASGLLGRAKQHERGMQGKVHSGQVCKSSSSSCLVLLPTAPFTTYKTAQCLVREVFVNSIIMSPNAGLGTATICNSFFLGYYGVGVALFCGISTCSHFPLAYLA